ncbi:hypothetical protein LUZ62_053638 [Rhynchospora pubera]|uniref:CCHC-type domain-containing protein n=1 Tax=Rhynchospora pubera TaxID=906938 RepID=A0AAV8DR43_9POAL|nr:hypothetical protein LUZ62_053638 [Rhynchospora pubera]
MANDDEKSQPIPPKRSALDSSSPFYLNSSDNPGMLITSCVLKEGNYDVWVKAVRNALRAKNKLGFIDGTVVKPKSGGKDDSLSDMWDMCNSMMVSWLFNSIDSDLQPSIAYCETVKELWDDLKERFSVGNAPRIYQLKSEIAAAKQHGNSVVAYYTRLKGMWDELSSHAPVPFCTCGGCTCNLTSKLLKDREDEKIHQFLMGLDDSVFGNVRTHILGMDPMPSLSKVYSMVVQEERHRSVVRTQDERTDAIGFSVHVQKGDHDQSKGGYIKKPSCTNCGKTGHDITRCYEIIGYPAGWVRGGRGTRGGRSGGRGRGRGRASAHAVHTHTGAVDTGVGTGEVNQPNIPGLSESQLKQILAIVNGSNSAGVNSANEKLQGNYFSPQWLLDSGASHHMTGCLDLLQDVTKVTPSMVTLPNGEQIVTNHEGTVALENGVVLKGVLYVPCLHWWKVYDMNTSKIFVTRDVVFDENVFPFADFTATSTEVDRHQLRQPTIIVEDANEHEIDAQMDRGSAKYSSDSQDSGVSPEIADEQTPLLEPHLASVDTGSATPVASGRNATEQDQGEQSPVIVRGDRMRRAPARYADYICYTARIDDEPNITGSSNSRYPINHCVTCNKFSHAHRVFLNAITKETEPGHFGEAIKCEKWCEAMRNEIDALERNNTWTVENLPPGKTAIGCKWVYRIKYNADGTVERYKARLVALGNRQIQGVDYAETFAPVAKMVSVRTFLAIAAIKGWALHQMDVHNAFLHGDLHEEVYMRLPPGFKGSMPDKVCRLHKSIYGLRQAPRMWFFKLTTTLEAYGFVQSKADYSLFTYRNGKIFLAILIYVDDLVVAGNDNQAICDFKKYMSTMFHMKDLGILKYFLGIEIARAAEGVFLSQRKYTLDLLGECGLLAAKPISTPLEQNHKLAECQGEILKDPESQPKYRSTEPIRQSLTVSPEPSHARLQQSQNPNPINYLINKYASTTHSYGFLSSPTQKP